MADHDRAQLLYDLFVSELCALVRPGWVVCWRLLQDLEELKSASPLPHHPRLRLQLSKAGRARSARHAPEVAWAVHVEGAAVGQLGLRFGLVQVALIEDQSAAVQV